MTTAVATPEAPAASGVKIKLMARYEKYRVRLESPEEVIDSHHGKYRVPGTGKMIEFSGWRAEIPEEWWPLLEGHAERVVQRGLVQREEDWMGATPRSGGPEIIVGAQAASVNASNVAPFQGWDEATVKDIVTAIDEGKVTDLAHAEEYEWGHRRRKMVVRAIVDARFGDEPAPEELPIAGEFHQPDGGEL